MKSRGNKRRSEEGFSSGEFVRKGDIRSRRFLYQKKWKVVNVTKKIPSCFNYSIWLEI